MACSEHDNAQASQVEVTKVPSKVRYWQKLFIRKALWQFIDAEVTWPNRN
jgi:hypothetical protein